MILLILFASLSVCAGQTEQSRVVITSQGPVKGYKTGSDVFQFFGIPYATAPNGTDRFKAPLPPKTWTEPFEATESFIACPHSHLLAHGLTMREDCLVANVFVPDTQQTNMSVLVYVHGGGFLMGLGNEHSPEHLVEQSKDIVAVTVNHRLRAHGFLCLGTEGIPGNAGLKDVLAALRWVKENIAYFGGNPHDVTIGGFSAGSVIVELLMLSKAAKGLFNKVIPESSAAVAPYAVQIDPLQNAKDYARILNFTNVEDLNAMEEFYKTIPLDELLSDISVLDHLDSSNILSPCVERDIGQERILEDSPVNLLKRGDYEKVPVLYGFANMEGMYRMPELDTWGSKMNENFSDFLPSDLAFADSNEKDAVAQTVKKFYFGNKTIGQDTLFSFIDYFSDVMFNNPVLRSLKMQVEAGSDSIYLYEFSFYKRFPPVPGVPDDVTNFPGADHCAQSAALHDTTRIPQAPEESFTEEYRLMRVKMRELWSNFITTGTPVPSGSQFPTWPPADATRSPHMDLGHSIQLGGALHEARAQFWDDIYDQYYRHPVPPTTSVTENGAAFVGSVALNLVLICFVNVLHLF